MNDIERLWKEGNRLKAIGCAIIYALGAIVVGLTFWLTKSK